MVLIIVSSWFSYKIIWPIDFLRGEPVVVKEIDLNKNTKAQLIQVLTNDFYYTVLLIKNADGKVLSETVIDPDSAKLWPWNCSLKFDQGLVSVYRKSRLLSEISTDSSIEK